MRISISKKKNGEFSGDYQASYPEKGVLPSYKRIDENGKTTPLTESANLMEILAIEGMIKEGERVLSPFGSVAGLKAESI